MRYKCLVLDHDDTAVKSTPEIHYPSFVEILERLRPDIKYTLEEFMEACFDPGFAVLCRDTLHFTDEEMKIEAEIWRSHTESTIPHFYDGFVDMVQEFKHGGGYVCVVSHSCADDIAKHYAPYGITPDLIYGWEYPEKQRKPYPFPLEDIMSKLGLAGKDLIVLDDLKLGLDMARSCGVYFAAAGWSHLFPGIRDYMKKNSDSYFETVSEFRNFLFGK